MKRIVFMILCLGLILCGCAEYSEEEAIEYISEYLQTRYEAVNVDNIDERYEEQEKYYHTDMISYPLWVNLPENIEAAKEFFRSGQYKSQILRKKVTKDDNKYKADISVVYIAENPEDYCYADYIFLIDIAEDEMKIKSINSIKNQLHYFFGAELHVTDDEVIMVYPEEHDAECDHTH